MLGSLLCCRALLSATLLPAFFQVATVEGTAQSASPWLSGSLTRVLQRQIKEQTLVNLNILLMGALSSKTTRYAH